MTGSFLALYCNNQGGQCLSHIGTEGSVPFGGLDTLTLAAPAQVFAGFFWDGSSGLRSPIGFNGAASSYIRYAGANAPALNTNISGGFETPTSRGYDFSVTIAAVPEPSTLALGAIGIAALGVARWRRRRTTLGPPDA